MNILQALKNTVNYLKLNTRQSLEESKIEADTILTRVLNLSKPSLYKNYDDQLDKISQRKIKDILYLRKNGTPLSYILESHTFYDDNFFVNKSVLIPRPETEYIVDKIIKYGDLVYKRKNRCLFIDAGTGSGCVGITIAKQRPHWNIFLSDLYMDTLKVAKINTKKAKNVNLICADWLSTFADNSVDFIFSNPPYIPLSDEYIEKSVENNEPLSALFSGVDGLDDIRKIISLSKNILSSSGVLFLEYGFKQSDEVSSLLDINDFTDIKVHLDYNGIERFSSCQKSYG